MCVCVCVCCDGTCAGRCRRIHVLRRWRHLVDSVALIGLNLAARQIQKAWKKYLKYLDFVDAVCFVQRTWRGHHGRATFADVVLHMRHDMATRIAKAWRAHVIRQMDQVIRRVRNAAAFVIQHAYARHLARIKWFQVRKLMSDRVAEDRRIEKENLLRQKRERFIERCFAMGDERAAKRIQKRWRAHWKWDSDRANDIALREQYLAKQKDDYDKLQLVLEYRKRAANVTTQAANVTKGISSTLGPAVGKLSRALVGTKSEAQKEKDALRAELGLEPTYEPKRAEKLKNAMFGLRDKQAQKELDEIMDNSILNRQTRSVEQTGIVDLKLTVGEQELVREQEQQKFNRSTGAPVYERVKRDLSGKLKSKVFIWYVSGSGKGVFSAVTPQRAPSNHKNVSANTSRIFGMKLAGTSVVGHNELNLELHGFSAMMAGESRASLFVVVVRRSSFVVRRSSFVVRRSSFVVRRLLLRRRLFLRPPGGRRRVCSVERRRDKSVMW